MSNSQESLRSQPASDTVQEPFPEIGVGYLPGNALVHFHFAPHVYGYNFEGAQQLLATADAYIPEARAWNYDALNSWNDLAKGKVKPSQWQRANTHNQQERDDYDVVQRMAVADIRKPIIFIDGSLRELGSSGLKVDLESHPDDPFEDIVNRWGEEVKRLSLESTRRDHIMIRNLGTKVWKLYKQNPDWAKREQVIILCTLGDAHVRVYDYLSQQQDSRENVAASMWVGTNEAIEATRIGDYFKEGKIPPRRLLVESVVGGILELPQVRRILKQPISVNLSPPHGQDLTEIESFSQRLVDLITDDIDDYPRLQKSLQSFLNRDIRPGYIALLREYIQRAKTGPAEAV
jgi:hypothetical protein